MEIKFILWTISYFALLTLILMAMIRLFHCPLDILDLIRIVRDTNDDDIMDLLDPRHEAELRAGMSVSEFRAYQRVRMVRAFEYLRRRLFNALMIMNMAGALHAEWQYSGESPPPAEAALILEILEAGIQFRMYGLLATAKLGLWILLGLHRWPIFPIPSLADLREAGKIDGMHAYERLTNAVGYYSLLLGEEGQELYQVLMFKLRGQVPSW